MSVRHLFHIPVVLLVIASVLAVGHSATAQEPQVRTTLSDGDSVWVGQGIELVVEILVPGYFASATSFDLPDPDGVLLMPPGQHPLVSNETRDGVVYTVQRHTLRAWPMRAGSQSIPAFTARFSYKKNPLDTDDIPASLTTPPIPFQVQLPPGADNLGTVISARDLKLEESWDSEPGTEGIKAGTAFTRTVTFTAPDVPGMVFPPFPSGDIDGLGIYTKQQIRDQENRGTLTGERQDKITYVCKRPGQFTIPAVTFTWFDLDAQQLRTETLPARTLNVIVNPDMASAGTGAVVAAGKNLWLILSGGLVLILVLFVVTRSRRVQQFCGRVIVPLRPVHLQPLNPLSREDRG